MDAAVGECLWMGPALAAKFRMYHSNAATEGSTRAVLARMRNGSRDAEVVVDFPFPFDNGGAARAVRAPTSLPVIRRLGYSR